MNRITRPFRILEIKRAMDQKCTLACIEYRPEIYQYQTSIPGFDSKGQQALMAMQPKAVVLTQYRAAGVDGRQQQCIGISFEPSADPAYRYVEVWYQKARGTKSKSDWLYAGRTSGDSFEIVGIDKYWTYEVKLLPVRSNGQKLYLGYAESYFITIEGITRAADLLYSTGENVDDLQPAEPLATAGAVVGDGLDVDGNLVRSDGSTLVTEDDLMLNNVLVRRIRIDSEGSFVTGLSGPAHRDHPGRDRRLLGRRHPAVLHQRPRRQSLRRGGSRGAELGRRVGALRVGLGASKHPRLCARR